jgi:hypothetical protein
MRQIQQVPDSYRRGAELGAPAPVSVVHGRPRQRPSEPHPAKPRDFGDRPKRPCMALADMAQQLPLIISIYHDPSRAIWTWLLRQQI